MAITVQGSGTQLAVIGTEHTLYDGTVGPTSGVFVCSVNSVNMVSGDTVTLRIYTRISAETLAEVYEQVFSGAQPTSDIIKISVPVPSDQGVKFTLKQTAGTGRNFAWKAITL